MHQYCCETIRIRTKLDTDKVTKAVLTLDQGCVQVNVRSFQFPGDGVFVATFTGEQMGRFEEGCAEMQLRGIVDHEEFKTNTIKINIKPVLLKEVITDD